jgi:CRISPR-associated protein Csb1
MQLVHADGGAEPFEIDREAAHRLYAEAYQAARRAGFEFPREPIRLLPQDKLVAIVRKSQQLALEGEGGEASEPS